MYFDLTDAMFVDCGIAVGLDDLRVDGKVLQQGLGPWVPSISFQLKAQ